MRQATFQLVSNSPYSQSRPHVTPKLNKETAGDYEARTWANRLHVRDGQVVIPAMSLRNCISEAAKFLSIQIPGKGKATYTKHFDSGIMITQDAPIFSHGGDPIVPPSELGRRKVLAAAPDNNKEDLEAMAYESPLNEAWGDWIFTPADGVPGSGKRVWKCYPMITQWAARFNVAIVDDTITEDIFETVLSQAGQLIGIGRFRVRNRGTYGMFGIDSIEWN